MYDLSFKKEKQEIRPLIRQNMTFLRKKIPPHSIGSGPPLWNSFWENQKYVHKVARVQAKCKFWTFVYSKTQYILWFRESNILSGNRGENRYEWTEKLSRNEIILPQSIMFLLQSMYCRKWLLELLRFCSGCTSNRGRESVVFWCVMNVPCLCSKRLYFDLAVILDTIFLRM